MLLPALLITTAEPLSRGLGTSVDESSGNAPKSV